MRAKAALVSVAFLLSAGVARADETTDQLKRDSALASELALQSLTAKDGAPHAWGRAELDLGGRLRYDDGRRVPSYASVEPSVVVAAAASRFTSIALTSRLGLSAPFGLSGSHLVDGSIGLGDLAKGRSGLDLGVRYAIEHASDPTPAERPIDVGPGAFVAQGGRASLAYRYGLGSDVALTFPLHYDYRRADFWSGSDSGSFQSQGGGLGFGFVGGDAGRSTARVQILGMTALGTTFSMKPGQTSATRRGSMDLEFLTMEFTHALDGKPEDQIYFALSPAGRFNDLSAPKAKLGFAGRMDLGLLFRERGAFGLTVLSDPTFTPDGSHSVGHYRGQLAATAQNLARTPLGGTIGGAIDYAERQRNADEKASARSLRLTGHLEGFVKLVPGGRVGVSYEVQRGPLDADAFDGRVQVGHAVLGFVRIGESF